jgi:hypothetical protein
MKLCLNCRRTTPGKPTFCNFCGSSFNVRLCPRQHINPRSAEVVAFAGAVSNRGADGLCDRLRAEAVQRPERAPAFDVSRPPAYGAIRNMDHAAEFPEGIHQTNSSAFVQRPASQPALTACFY